MSTGFSGFDVDKVAALRRVVGSLESSATSISTTVGLVNTEAQSHLDTGYGVSPQYLLAHPYVSNPTDPDRVGLHTVATASPAYAADIERRLTHLSACTQLAGNGFPIDSDVAFRDDDPPSESKIRSALRSIRRDLGDDKPRSEKDFVDTLSGLTPAELDAVMAKLGDDELAKINKMIKLGDRSRTPGIPSRFGNRERVRLANILLSRLGKQQLARVMTHLPLEPGTHIKGVRGVRWREPIDRSLYGPNGKASIKDINQGAAGDCWFLAGIAAELKKDPDFVNKHIRQNPNGTYTVTFYRNGKPIRVTVDGRVPVYRNGSTPFSHPTGSWDTDGPCWIEIYEKAFAQLHGSYHAIEYGWGSRSMREIMGRPSKLAPISTVNMKLLREKWAKGHPITVGSVNNPNPRLAWKHQEYFNVDHQKFVGAHEYVVVGFGTSKNHPGEVRLYSPWGASGNANEYVWVNEKELQKYFRKVSIGND